MDAQTDFLVEQGLEAVQRGDEQTAETLWKRAASLGHPTAQFNLGVMAYDRGRYKEAIQFFQPLSDGNDPEPSVKVAESFRKMGQESEALRWYQKAAEVGSAPAMYELGLNAETHGRRADAIAWYEAAMDSGSDAWAANNLGNLYLVQGNVSRAREVLERAVDWGDAELLFTLGQICELMGDGENARRWLQKSSAMGFHKATDRLAKMTSPLTSEKSSSQVKGSKFCTECGSTRAPSERFCGECGNQYSQ